MAEVGSAYVSILPSAKGFAGKLGSEIGPGVDRAGKDSGIRFGKVFARSYSGPLKAVGAAAVGLFAIDKVKEFFSASIAEARESQKVGALTAQVIKSTGGAAHVSAAQVGELSTAISNKTGIDDEAIQSASNLLLTFKNLRNETGKGNDVFNQATQAATDMGAALGKDPRSGAIQLGKALNDPIKGITALTRVGVSFTDQQKKQIAAMVKSGNTLGAQKIILGELKSEFGGAAAASSTAGEKMSVAFKNFQEQIGTALLPLIDRLETTITTKVIPAVSLFLTQMQNGTGAGGRFADKLKSLGATLQSIAGFIAQNRAVIIPLVAGFVAAVAVIRTVAAVIRIWTAAQTILNFVLTANPVGVVIVAIAALVAGIIIAYKHSDTFRTIVQTAFRVIAAGAQAMWGIIRPILKLWVDAWLITVGAILHGAALAFGWIPGIGPKLKAAAAKFDEFKNAVNKALDGTQSTKNITVTTPGMRQAINDLATLRLRLLNIPKSVTVGVNNKINASGLAGARASGGPVSAGKAYLVGEKRPEVFVPDRNGSILPSVPTSGAGLTINGDVYGADAKAIVDEQERRARRKAALYPVYA